MNKPLSFRPHHLLCALNFKGKGYTPQFVSNFKNIMDRLALDEATPIRVVEHTDSFCEPCPHRRVRSCEKQSRIEKLDKAHSEVLGIKHGEVLTWQDAKARIRELVTMAEFHRMCEGCSWKPSGICENNLREFSGGAVAL